MTVDTIPQADITLNLVARGAGPRHAIVAELAREAAFDEITAPLRRAWCRGLWPLVRSLSVLSLRRSRLAPRLDRR